MSSNIKPYIPLAFDEKKDINEKKEKQENIKDSVLKIYEKSKKEGYNVGFKEGYEKGFKKASEDIEREMKKLKSKISELDKIIQSLVNFKEDQIKSLLPEILGLSIKIAKKIVSSELSLNKNIVLNIIKETLKEVSMTEKIIIKINPKDYENLKDEIEQISGLNSSVKIITSADIHQGSFLLDTEDNIIESKVDEKFQEIENAINSVLYSKD